MTDETRASIWVETADAGQVEVRLGDERHSTPTWSVHGHHYALVPIERQGPGQFLAEIAQLSGRPALVDGHADEEVEALLVPPEQLRALWHGERIVVAITHGTPAPGVDTPDDLARVRALYPA